MPEVEWDYDFKKIKADPSYNPDETPEEDKLLQTLRGDNKLPPLERKRPQPKVERPLSDYEQGKTPPPPKLAFLKLVSWLSAPNPPSPTTISNT